MGISFTADNSPAGEDMLFECQCGGLICNQPCRECNGSGEIRFPTLQYEAGGYCAGNVAPYIKEMTRDGEFDYCGYVKPDQVTTVLERLKQHPDEPRLRSIIRVFLWAESTDNGVTWS